MNNALVSIITPCYNSEKYIAESIESVINQTYKNWELIIINDCSSDNSKKIIEAYQNVDLRIKLIDLKENSGAAISRNKGIDIAKGDFIAFLDADDLWKTNKLELQLEFMITNTYLFTCSSYEQFYGNRTDYLIVRPKKDRIGYTDLLSSNKIGCLTAIYNAKALGKHFMPEIRKRQDYATWLNILKEKELYCYRLDKVLSRKRVLKESVSSNKIEMLKWNYLMFRKTQNFSIIKSLFLVQLNILNKVFN